MNGVTWHSCIKLALDIGLLTSRAKCTLLYLFKACLTKKNCVQAGSFINLKKKEETPAKVFTIWLYENRSFIKEDPNNKVLLSEGYSEEKPPFLEKETHLFQKVNIPPKYAGQLNP